MLNKDPKARITAQDALKHPWLSKYNKDVGARTQPGEDVISSLRNLRNFEAETMMQKAVLSYIASQEIDPVYEKKLRMVFDILDTDKNGQVSCEELADEYAKIYRDKAEVQRACLKALKKADFNRNGFIDYNGILLV